MQGRERLLGLGLIGRNIRERAFCVLGRRLNCVGNPVLGC